MTIQLREYQEEAIDAVFSDYKARAGALLIHLPTGAGKTVIMAEIARRFNKRTLLLAHREELIMQAFDRFKHFWKDADVGIVMGKHHDIDHQIVIGSVQSCCKKKRLQQLKDHGFDLMMIDEAHHSTAGSYAKIINSLGFQRKKSDKLLIGVTATPARADKSSLVDVFDKISFSRSISTLVKAGYLAPVVGRKILTSSIVQDVTMNRGDFAIGELDAAVNTPPRNALVAQRYIEHAKDRKGIAFCCTVKHCHDLKNAFIDAGIQAESIWGDMDPDVRKHTLKQLKSGEIQVVTSCGVLTEGFDEPSISCIAMARPTKSKSLYIQCIGRGLRLFEGKEDCLVLDFTDEGHSLDGAFSLEKIMQEDRDPSPEQEEEREAAKKHEEDKRIAAIIDERFDILGDARFIWTDIGDNELSLMDDDGNEIVISPVEEKYIAFFYQNKGSEHIITPKAHNLKYTIGVCEDWARKNLKVTYSDGNSSWISSESPPTIGQMRTLERMRISYIPKTKGEASTLIRTSIALKKKKERKIRLKSPENQMTNKQKWFLIGMGINPDGLTKAEASRIIGQKKANQVAV